MPANTVYVGRPGAWGNPYRVGDPGVPDAQTAVDPFRREFTTGVRDESLVVADLAGKNLACWCPPDQPCHAAVLLEIANR